MPRQVDSPKPSLRTPPRSSDSRASVAFIIDMPGAMQPDGHLRCARSARQRSRMNIENGQAGAKSLQPQTGWRWSQSRANPSRGPNSLISREDTGNSRDLGPSPWQSGRNKVGFRYSWADFPASRNRERNRDEQGTLWTEQGKKAGGGLPREGQATGAASKARPSRPSGDERSKR